MFKKFWENNPENPNNPASRENSEQVKKLNDLDEDRFAEVISADVNMRPLMGVWLNMKATGIETQERAKLTNLENQVDTYLKSKGFKIPEGKREEFYKYVLPDMENMDTQSANDAVE